MSDEYTLTDARILDVEAGAYITGAVRVSDGRIAEVLTDADVPSDGRSHSLGGRVVMPGMVDLHLHVSYRNSAGPYEFDLARNLPEVTVDAVWNARLAIEAGFTSARDCGSAKGVSAAIKRSINDGEIVGPRLQVAGQIVSGVGGLADYHPSHLFPDNDYATALGYTVTSVDDAHNIVRRQVKDGADWIKVGLSGTASNAFVPAERDDLIGPRFEAIVEETTLLGVPIIAHVESELAAVHAARAGVKTIEHGVSLTPPAIDLMVANDVTLVPTLAQYSTWALRGAELGKSERSQKAQARVHDRHVASIRAAHAAGVRIATGGDSGGTHFPQVSTGKELGALVEQIEMTPAEVLRAATMNGAHVLGWGDRIGKVEPGYLADLLVVDGDPLESPSLLGDPDSIDVVVKGGEVLKGRL